MCTSLWHSDMVGGQIRNPLQEEVRVMSRYDVFKGNRWAMVPATLVLAVIVACGGAATPGGGTGASSAGGAHGNGCSAGCSHRSRHGVHVSDDAPQQAQAAPTAVARRYRGRAAVDGHRTGGQDNHGPGGDQHLQRPPGAFGQPAAVRHIHRPRGGGPVAVEQQLGGGTAADRVLEHLGRFCDLDLQHPQGRAVPQGIRRNDRGRRGSIPIPTGSPTPSTPGPAPSSGSGTTPRAASRLWTATP